MSLNEKRKYRKDETSSQLCKKLKKSETKIIQWKHKNREKQEETKILKMRMKEAKASRDRWRDKNKEKISENEILKEKLLRIEEELIKTKIENMNLLQENREKRKNQSKSDELNEGIKNKRSPYTIYLKWLLVYIIICSTAPFRTLEKILKAQVLCGLFTIRKIPSDSSCRRWFNQVGYYKLTRAKEKAKDWIYIIDNSIRSENRKVCLILGVRASKLKQGRCPSFEDLEPIELRILNANSELEEIIKDGIKKTGIPIQICSDTGSDVMPSIKKVMAIHQEIKHIPFLAQKCGNFRLHAALEYTRTTHFLIILPQNVF